MTALSIQPTYPIFTDIDGQPLENGYIWIGTANLDPQTNPINVYWDEALTISAPQPIRTLAGYPSRSGSPGRLYVNSLYSIRVQNRNGSMVYSAPTPTEEYAGLISPFNGNFVAERFTAGFGPAADYPKAGLHINKTATNHAHYGVLDNTYYDFTGSTDVVIGSASYNDNTQTRGTHAVDHHYSFQSYPNVQLTGAQIDYLSGLYSIAVINGTGTVANRYGAKIDGSLGTGAITNEYGVRVGAMTRGSYFNVGIELNGANGGSASNWNLFAAGGAWNTPSFFGGSINMGTASTPYSSIKYDANLGHIMLTPRDTFDVKIARVNTSGAWLRFGDPSTDSFDAKIGYQPTGGALELYPRAGYATQVAAGAFYVSAAGQRIGVGFGIGTTPDTQLHLKDSTDRAGITMENTAGPNKWQILPALPGSSNVGLSFYDSLAASNKTRFYIDSSGNSQPGTDNVFSMGVSGSRWSVIYAATGAINTSDAREKTAVSALTSAEIEASKALAKEIGTYKFLNAVAEKGDKARMHVGMTVQRAIEIMTGHGLQPTAYGFICHDSWEDSFENVQVNVGQKVKKTRTFTRAKMESVERQKQEIVMINGKAVEQIVVYTEDVPAFIEHDVVDSNGNPVMEVVAEAKAPIFDDNGNMLEPGAPALMKQKKFHENVMETVTEEYEEDAAPVYEKRLLKAAGDRYSFRPDELLMFIARGIDARISAIETKTA
jgi:hypothetical protein